MFPILLWGLGGSYRIVQLQPIAGEISKERDDCSKINVVQNDVDKII